MMKGDHIGGGAGVSSLRLTESSVGVLAYSPQGLPVLAIDTSADSEVASVAYDGLGAQGAVFLEVLLEPGRLIDAAQLRVYTTSNDLGGELARRASRQLSVEEQDDIVRAADIEVIVESDPRRKLDRLEVA